MRYPTYSTYKESGIEWLGQIPEEWEVWKLSHGFQNTGSGTTPPSDNDVWYDGDIPWVTTSELRESIIFDTAKKVTKEAVATFSALKIFPKGSLAIAMYGATIGRIGVFGVPATTNQACCVMYGERSLRARFMFLWLQAFREQIVLLASGGGQPNISQEKIRSIRVACPPLSEQTAIANFLDRETGRIDTLVAKKRRMIALLKEKRTALISRTVTRGLPATVAREFGIEPHTHFKDSGIEWLGQVPEGWEVFPIKRIVSTPVTDGPHETPEILDDGVPFVSAEAINNGRINFDRIRGYISKEDHGRYSKKYKPEYGDIYMVKSGATTGRIAMVETDEEFNIWSPLAAIRCESSIANRGYVYFYLQSREFQKAVELHWSFGTQQNIGMGVIQNLSVPIGDTKEQNAIAAYLDRETAKIDRLEEKIEVAIVRLQEYRTALITAAVTGKIDVREAIS